MHAPRFATKKYLNSIYDVHSRGNYDTLDQIGLVAWRNFVKADLARYNGKLSPSLHPAEKTRFFIDFEDEKDLMMFLLKWA